MQVYKLSYDVSKKQLNEWVALGKRIVRCKDCKYLHEYEKKTWANNIPYKVQQCEYWADSTWGSVEIEPDGFCAWGERRQDA